jgi:hypothetical protein
MECHEGDLGFSSTGFSMVQKNIEENIDPAEKFQIILNEGD